jgi:hypothetical protein
LDKPFPAYQGDEPYVFVCYAHDDKAVVYPEIAWLRERGINVWYDEGIPAGSNWRAAIGDSLLTAKSVLFYVSGSSLRSDHCNREINLALDEGIAIVPVYLKDVALTTDLRVGLSRVQALHHDSSSLYRARLLEAMGKPVSVQIDSASRTTTLPHRKSMAAAGILAVCVVGWLTFIFINGQEDSRLEDRSIVVLPFDNLSAEAENEYLAGGLTEELTTLLSKVAGLRVIGRTSANHFKGMSFDPTLIHDRLRVRYAIEGSVRRAGDELRITARLVAPPIRHST